MNESMKLTGVGFLVGILSGLLGVGGGVFLVPIMVTYFSITQHIAHATSLAVVIPTAIVSSIVYGFHGQTDMVLSLQIIAGSILGASIGARLMKKIPAAQLKRLFGLMLALVGLRMVLS
ncbi:MAG: sulfite exporter TauE/SafE family protein [Negativicutes bacterium]|nr:sulfite exporter TauE/SafE family protein [Negativicutes bacterium]